MTSRKAVWLIFIVLLFQHVWGSAFASDKLLPPPLVERSTNLTTTNLVLNVQAFLERCYASGNLSSRSVDLLFQERLVPVSTGLVDGRVYDDQSRIICVDSVSIAHNQSYLVWFQDRHGYENSAILLTSEDGSTTLLEKFPTALGLFYTLAIRVHRDKKAEVSPLVDRIRREFSKHAFTIDAVDGLPLIGIFSSDPVFLHRVKSFVEKEEAVRTADFSGVSSLADFVPLEGPLIRLDSAQKTIELMSYFVLSRGVQEQGVLIRSSPVNSFPCEMQLKP